MFYYDRESISLVFRKTKCNIRSIHDEFSGCLNRSKYTGINYYEFKHNKLDIKACVKLNHDYDVKLPKSNQELYEWGEYMHNCIASYDYLVRCNETVIYGFFNGDTLQFVAEISDHHIKEASGRYNAILKQQESSILQIWFRRFFTESQQGDKLCRQM